MSEMMDHQHPGNPLAEGVGHAAGRTSEIAGLLMMAAEYAARARARRLEAENGNRDEQAQLRTDHTADRLRWAPALERDFAPAGALAPGTGTGAGLATVAPGPTTHEAMQAWVAAQPWVDHDPSAAQASARAEERLGVLHPDLMAEYRGYRGDGMEPTAAMLEAGRTVSAPAWRDVLDPGKRQDMGVDETLGQWNAARPWAASAPQPEGLWSPRSEEAAQAMGEAEAQLRRLRPTAMADYDEARAMGVDPLDAMRSVAPQLGAGAWVTEQGRDGALDPGAAQAARTLAVEERGEAQHGFATPDLPATRDVDEHTLGARVGVEHEEVSEASAARASTLATQSYPQPVHVALANPQRGAAAAAPGAATARQAAGRRR